jgi:glycosyltransferase domain-containing protein
MFSLVVPTYNRPFFLQRLLRYYADLVFPHPIVVADSSFGPALEQNRKLLESVRNVLSISHQVYLHTINPYDKLAAALGSLESPYAGVCADDDFLVPEGIAKCLDFLKSHPDYVMAHGLSMAFIATGDGVDQLNSIQSAATYPQNTIDSDSAIERLADHLARYTATYYSVHRRPQLQSNLQRSARLTVDYRFGELLASCLSIVQGKARCLNALYMVRQIELTPPTRKYSEKMLPWREILKVNDFPARYTRFRDCLIEELTAVSGISIERAADAVDRSFGKYISQCTSAAPTSVNSPAARFYRLMKTMPAAVLKAIVDRQLMPLIRAPRASYRRVLALQDEMSLISLLNPKSPFHKEFMQVYKYLKPGAADRV